MPRCAAGRGRPCGAADKVGWMRPFVLLLLALIVVPAAAAERAPIAAAQPAATPAKNPDAKPAPKPAAKKPAAKKPAAAAPAPDTLGARYASEESIRRYLSGRLYEQAGRTTEALGEYYRA